MSLLTVRNMSKRFGGLTAVDNVSLSINRGEIYGLIGPNGAGKTTCFNLITGLYPADSGEFFIADKPYFPKQIEKVTAAGIARTFQNIRLFSEMTVLENVMIGRHCRTHAGILSALLRDPRTVREEQDTIDKSYDLLKTVGLETFWNETAHNLPYGAQRRLEIARALATEPILLLLDEPAAGMNPQETNELKALIRSLRDSYDLSVLLIEHDMSMVMSLSDTIYVMEYGSPIASGTPEEIRSNPDVIKAYLGESHDA